MDNEDSVLVDDDVVEQQQQELENNTAAVVVASSSAAAAAIASPTSVLSSPTEIPSNNNNNKTNSNSKNNQSSGKIKTCIRIRPSNPKEAASKDHRNVVRIPPLHPNCVVVDSATEEELANRRLSKTIVHKPQAFDGFHTVFGPHTEQDQVFDSTAKEIVLDSFRGLNGAMMAYGPTSSGKTHTMFGSELSAPGVIPRATAIMFRRKEELEDEGKYVNVKVWFVEVYNEQVRDLLAQTPGTILKLQDRCSGGVGPNGACCDVAGATYVYPTSADMMLQIVDRGFENRVSHETYANQHSSRSHAILSIDVEVRDHPEATSGSLGKMKFCDLAGSERAAGTRNEGMRFREGANINRSLLALGAVVQALSKPNALQSFIPYRGSKLTRLLRECIGGNCNSLLLVCVSPSSMSIEETLNTLHYATLARKIDTQVRINTVEISPEVMKQQYELALSKKDQEIDALKEELRKLYAERVVHASTSLLSNPSSPVQVSATDHGDGENENHLVNASTVSLSPQSPHHSHHHSHSQHHRPSFSEGGEILENNDNDNIRSGPSSTDSSPEKIVQVAASRLRALSKKLSREIGIQTTLLDLELNLGESTNINSNLSGSRERANISPDRFSENNLLMQQADQQLSLSARGTSHHHSIHHQRHSLKTSASFRGTNLESCEIQENNNNLNVSGGGGGISSYGNANNNLLSSLGSNSKDSTSGGANNNNNNEVSPVDALLVGDLQKSSAMSFAFHSINDRLNHLIEMRDSIFNDAQRFGEGSDFALDVDIRSTSLEVVQYLCSNHTSKNNSDEKNAKDIAAGNTNVVPPVAVPRLLETLGAKRELKDSYAEKREQLTETQREYQYDLTALNKEIHTSKELASEFERRELKHRIEIQRERMSYLEAEELASVYIEQKRLEKQVNEEFRAALPRCVEVLERNLESLSSSALANCSSCETAMAAKHTYDRLSKQRREVQAALAFLKTPVTPTEGIVSEIVERLDEFKHYNAAVYSQFESLLASGALLNNTSNTSNISPAQNDNVITPSTSSKSPSVSPQQQQKQQQTSSQKEAATSDLIRTNSDSLFTANAPTLSGSHHRINITNHPEEQQQQQQQRGTSVASSTASTTNYTPGRQSMLASALNVPMLRHVIPAHLDVTQRRSMMNASSSHPAITRNSLSISSASYLRSSNNNFVAAAASAAAGSENDKNLNASMTSASGISLNASAGGRIGAAANIKNQPSESGSNRGGASHAFWGSTTVRSRNALAHQISLKVVRTQQSLEMSTLQQHQSQSQNAPQNTNAAAVDQDNSNLESTTSSLNLAATTSTSSGSFGSHHSGTYHHRVSGHKQHKQQQQQQQESSSTTHPIAHPQLTHKGDSDLSHIPKPAILQKGIQQQKEKEIGKQQQPLHHGHPHNIHPHSQKSETTTKHHAAPSTTTKTHQHQNISGSPLRRQGSPKLIARNISSHSNTSSGSGSGNKTTTSTATTHHHQQQQHHHHYDPMNLTVTGTPISRTSTMTSSASSSNTNTSSTPGVVATATTRKSASPQKSKTTTKKTTSSKQSSNSSTSSTTPNQKSSTKSKVDNNNHHPSPLMPFSFEKAPQINLSGHSNSNSASASTTTTAASSPSVSSHAPPSGRVSATTKKVISSSTETPTTKHQQHQQHESKTSSSHHQTTTTTTSVTSGNVIKRTSELKAAASASSRNTDSVKGLSASPALLTRAGIASFGTTTSSSSATTTTTPSSTFPSSKPSVRPIHMSSSSSGGTTTTTATSASTSSSTQQKKVSAAKDSTSASTTPISTQPNSSTSPARKQTMMNGKLFKVTPPPPSMSNVAVAAAASTTPNQTAKTPTASSTTTTTKRVSGTTSTSTSNNCSPTKKKNSSSGSPSKSSSSSSTSMKTTSSSSPSKKSSSASSPKATSTKKKKKEAKEKVEKEVEEERPTTSHNQILSKESLIIETPASVAEDSSLMLDEDTVLISESNEPTPNVHESKKEYHSREEEEHEKVEDENIDDEDENESQHHHDDEEDNEEDDNETENVDDNDEDNNDNDNSNDCEQENDDEDDDPLGDTTEINKRVQQQLVYDDENQFQEQQEEDSSSSSKSKVRTAVSVSVNTVSSRQTSSSPLNETSNKLSCGLPATNNQEVVENEEHVVIDDDDNNDDGENESNNNNGENQENSDNNNNREESPVPVVSQQNQNNNNNKDDESRKENAAVAS